MKQLQPGDLVTVNIRGMDSDVGVILKISGEDKEWGWKSLLGRTADVHWSDGTVSECSLKVLKSVRKNGRS